MASSDDEGRFETDFAELAVPPEPSRNAHQSKDGEKERYMDHLSRMPIDLQIDNNDIVIVNAPDDNEPAKKFKNKILETYLHIQEDGTNKKIHPKVMLIGEIPQKDFDERVGMIFQSSGYIFLFASGKLCDSSSSILSKLETVFKNFTRVPGKEKHIIPVHTKSKKFRDYTLKVDYSGIKPIEAWSIDQFFEKNMQNLLGSTIYERLARDKELDRKRKQWMETSIDRANTELPERLVACKMFESEHGSEKQVKNNLPRKSLIDDISSGTEVEMDGPTPATTPPSLDLNGSQQIPQVTYTIFNFYDCQNTVVGHNGKIINEVSPSNDGNDDDDGNSDSSESGESQENFAEDNNENERLKTDAQPYTRSTGGRFAMASEGLPPAQTQPSTRVSEDQAFQRQGPYYMGLSEETSPKCLMSMSGYEEQENASLSDETRVKSVCEDEPGLSDQTKVKTVS